MNEWRKKKNKRKMSVLERGKNDSVESNELGGKTRGK